MQNGGQVLACPPSANIQLYGSSILHPKGKQWFYIFKYASRKPGIWAAKNPDKIGVFAEHIFFMFLLWRRVRDSNPRGREPKRFSRPPRYDHFDNSPYQKSTLMGTFLAQKEGFEPSRAFYTPTPLAGEPLRPLGYFCTMPLKYNSIAQRHCQEFSQQMRT